MRIEFFKEFVERPRKTRELAEKMEAEGTPEKAHIVFDEVDMCLIRASGDRNSAFYGEVTKQIKEEYPREWKAYQDGETGKLDGYPLKEWAAISAPQARHFLTAGISTVEELASVSDSNLQTLGPSAVRLRDLAVKWLADYKKDQPLLAVAEENNDLKKQLAAQQARLDALEAQARATPPAAAPAPAPATPAAHAAAAAAAAGEPL